MQASQIPPLFLEPFANTASGTLTNYPLPDTVSSGSGLASLNAGFQAANFQPEGSGGIAPYGADFNGLEKQDTAWAQWLSIGGPIPWSNVVATFMAGIGGTVGSNAGYPKGAIVDSATTLGQQWLSTVDNNVTNPDTGGAGWVGFNSYHQAPPNAVHVESASIGPSYSNAVTLTFTAPCAGTIRGEANLNLAAVAAQPVTFNMTNSLNATVAGGTSVLTQYHPVLIGLSSGQSVTLTLTVTSPSGSYAATSADFTLQYDWTPSA